MKKIYFLLFTFLITSVSFGQASDLYFSMYGEGSSNNKFLEIYNGTGADVDLGNYSIETYPNGAATAQYTLTFTGGTILTNGDVYVIYNSSADAAIIANGDVSSSVTFFNGDDAVALLKTGTGVIDIIGQIGFDPGTAWNVGSTSNGTAEHTLVRKSDVCDPNPVGADSFGSDDATSEWNVYGQNQEWGQIGSHTGCPTAPTLYLIGLPPSGSTIELGPEDLAGDLEFATANFTVGEPGTGTEGDGYILWDITNVTDGSVSHDSGNIYDISTPTPFTTLLPNKEYYLAATLLDNTGQPVGNIESVYVLTANTLGYNVVTDIAALRSHVDTNGEGLYYEITGVSLVTHTDGYQNRKWIQDNNISGLLISDVAGTISTTYNVGDNVTGLKGQTSLSSGGLLTLTPSIDSGVVESSGNSILPQIVTIPDFNTNYADYESEIVEIQDVTFDIADGVVKFATGTNYNVSDAGTNTVVMRTDYFSADYIGQVIPTTTIPSLVAVAGKFGTTPQIYARSLSDLSLSTKDNKIDGFAMYPNPTSLGYLNITSKNQTAMKVGVYDVLGKQVIHQTVNNNRLDVSNLTTGIYIMKISQDNVTTTKKLIIK